MNNNADSLQPVENNFGFNPGDPESKAQCFEENPEKRDGDQQFHCVIPPSFLLQ